MARRGSWPADGRTRTALVTGAARGIGAGTARQLAARGWQVALVGLEPAELEKVAASCGARAVWFEADITDPAALDAAVTGTVERFGGIDAVLSNAGIAPLGMIRNVDPVAFERTLDINLTGQWRTVRACLPHVMASRGYINVVASVAAIVHLPGMAAYAASKAGVEAFTDALRFEMLPHGVDVGCTYLSWVSTELVQGADRTVLGGAMRSKLPGVAGRTYPVEDAVAAVAAGIEARRRVVAYPPWVRAVLPLRGVLTGLATRNVAKLVGEADRLSQEEVDRHGAAAVSQPVGAGGAAATRSAEAAATSSTEGDAITR